MYAIDIIDSSGKHVGELMTATPSDIVSLLNKGMTVIDKSTGHQYELNEVCSMIGVSEGIVTV